MKAPSNDATLSNLSLGGIMFHPAFVPNRMQYTSPVSNTVTSLMVTPTTANALATVKVDGTTVASGTASESIPLVTGPNTVTITVTAENGVTTKTYTVTVTRALPANANITRIKLSSGTLSPAFAQATTSYTASVTNAVSSVTVTPTASDPLATLTVNGSAVNSGSASGPVPLNVGDNIITTKATAQNGTTTKTYTITVTRAMAPANSLYQPASVIKPAENPRLSNDGIAVHQGVSPNGDGDNDFLVIDGITNYPDNELLIMSRTGDLVFEVSGYNNHSHVFDGHSNKNGKMQSPGTYFYSLDYKADGVARHKTGFIVLKY
jgi:gliding motility-associated-like protein